MNKKLIALAVAAASISSVATAAEVYSDETSSLAVGGRFEARALVADDANGDTQVNDKTRVRLNIAGKTDITDTVYALGFYEAEYASNTSANDSKHTVNHRHINAGIGGDFGQVRYGKTDGSLGMLTDFTDIMSYHGNGAGSKIAAADRTSNNLAYVGSFDLGGNNLTVKANYVFEGVEDSTVSYEDGYSVGAIYAMDMGLAFGAGYGEQDIVGQTDTQKQAFGAISYTFGDFYVAGLYQDARNTQENGTQDAEGFELAAAYTYGKTVFTGTYNYLENTDAKKDVVDAFNIDATHYFNKNFRTYASYKFNNLDKKFATKAQRANEFVLGARYDF
ncbi:membrane protein [Photobacterium gaetbulicola]|uniref:Membrane protein n=1 Tax=Photobacterium gaetbulicola TaxID=1295392 RepID=A0A0B9FQA2_9GAMM|nr:porin [Photobacterium gaetbulicola]KHT58209.1 membrane protein [Photobacterium gaetbulicola]